MPHITQRFNGTLGSQSVRNIAFTECFDRLYTVAVEICGGDEELATYAYDDALNNIALFKFQDASFFYVSALRIILSKCKEFLRCDVMIMSQGIPEDIYTDPDVRDYLEHRMQTAEAELAEGKTVSLRMLMEEHNRDEQS